MHITKTQAAATTWIKEHNLGFPAKDGKFVEKDRRQKEVICKMVRKSLCIPEHLQNNQTK